VPPNSRDELDAGAACLGRPLVRYCVPIAAERPLLDYLVGGGQKRFWDGEAERFGGLDDEFELGRLHDRQCESPTSASRSI
jgi:hypothetical protein